jgi:hypothetical protein
MLFMHENADSYDPDKFSHGGKVHNSATEAQFSHEGKVQPQRHNSATEASLDNSATRRHLPCILHDACLKI